MNDEALIVAALKAITSLALSLRSVGVPPELIDEAVRSEEDRSDELMARLREH